MAGLKNAFDNFNEALFEVANEWQIQQNAFTDPKVEQFGESVLRPLSVAGARINDQATAFGKIIARLEQLGLVTYY